MVVRRAVPVVRGGQWCMEGSASDDRDDGGGGGGFPVMQLRLVSVSLHSSSCLNGTRAN